MKEEYKCNEREGAESHYPWTQKAETSTALESRGKNRRGKGKGKKVQWKYHEVI
jgi:hypothetical protein